MTSNPFHHTEPAARDAHWTYLTDHSSEISYNGDPQAHLMVASGLSLSMPGIGNLSFLNAEDGPLGIQPPFSSEDSGLEC